MDKNLQFMDACVYGGYLYFSACNFNGMFRVKMGESEAEFLGHFKEEYVWQEDLHRQVINIGEKLYFVPFNGKGISIYEKKTGELSFIEIKEIKENPIVKAILIANDIFMIPVNLKCPFILFHSENNTYEILWDLWDSVKALHSQPEEFWFGKHSACISNSALYMKGPEGTILCIDLKNWAVHLYELPRKYKFRNLYYDNGDIYCTLSDQCKVVCWNCYTNEWKEYSLSHIEDIDFHSYMVVFRWKEHLMLMPDRANHILVLDKMENEWHIQFDYIPENFNRVGKQENLFLGYGCLGDKLLLYPQAGNGMVILEGERGNLCKIRYSDEMQDVVDKIGVKYIEKQIAEYNIIYENNNVGINLKGLILEKASISFKRKEKINENIGKKIWEYYKHIKS